MESSLFHESRVPLELLNEIYQLASIQEGEQLLFDLNAKKELCKWFEDRIYANTYGLKEAFVEPFSEQTAWAETKLIELEELLTLPWIDELCQTSPTSFIYSASKYRETLAQLRVALDESKSKVGQ